MPVYEYRCLSCEGDFELLVRSSSDNAICPVCESRELKRKFSVFGMNTGGGRFESSAGQSCGGCTSHSCSGCKH